MPGVLAIGIKVRTAKCIAVALGGDRGAPELLHREELRTWDPEVPDSAQPYHAGLEHSPEIAQPIVEDAAIAVRRASAAALATLLAALGDKQRIAGVGLVVSSVTDPESIANPHMRAHASEGRLFYEALLEAAEASGLSCATFLEKELRAQACKRLGKGDGALAAALAKLGKQAGPPWRAVEKAACLAAWLQLEAEGR